MEFPTLEGARGRVEDTARPISIMTAKADQSVVLRLEADVPSLLPPGGIDSCCILGSPARAQQSPGQGPLRIALRQTPEYDEKPIAKRWRNDETPTGVIAI